MGYKGILGDFCQDTSCHALDRVGDPERKRCARIVWFIIWLVAVGLLMNQYYMIVTRYLSYQVVVETTLDFSELAFPAVTVCNLNLVPASKVPANSSLTDALNLYQNLVNADLSDSNFRNNFCKTQTIGQDVMSLCNEFIAAAQIVYDSSNGKATFPRKPILYWQAQLQNVFPAFLEKFDQNVLTSLQQDAEDMVLDCVFNAQDCTNNINGWFDYEAGTCFTIQPQTGSTVKSDGPAGGLSLLIDVNINDYLPTTDLMGVRVYVHNNGTEFDLESSGYYAAVGARTSFAIRMLKTLRKGPPYGDCSSSTQAGISSSYYFTGAYTINGCMKTCMQKQIVQQCNCKLVGFGTPPSSPKYCWNSTLACASQVTQAVSNNNQWTKDSCGCPSPCSTVEYTNTMASAVWPAPGSVDSMNCVTTAKGTCTPGNASQYYNANTLELEIYYDSLNYNEYQERADYELTDMFSDIGAYLGLLLGASFCTCMEAMSLLITLCMYTCRLTKKNNIEMKDEKEGEEKSEPQEMVSAKTAAPFPNPMVLQNKAVSYK